MRRSPALTRRRRLGRAVARRTLRRAVRGTVRIRWRAPDELGQALVCYRRAIRAHERAARLAPRFFDNVLIERERREREAQRRWMDLWEPALAKVYGTATNPPASAARHLPPLPSLHKQLEVDRELAAWVCWLAQASDLLARHRQRRPHALMSLNRMASLLELGMKLGRLATGIDPDNPNPQPHNHEKALADLKRLYGSAPEPTPPAPDPEPGALAVDPIPPLAAPSDQTPNQSPGPNFRPASGPEASPQPVPMVPGTAAPGMEHRRRDAWSSWARYRRR